MASGSPATTRGFAICCRDDFTICVDVMGDFGLTIEAVEDTLNWFRQCTADCDCEAMLAVIAAVAGVGLDPTTPYALRHSFASLLAHEGRSIAYIAAQLGHEASLSADTYQHVLDDLEDAPRIPAEEAIRRARGGLREVSG